MVGVLAVAFSQTSRLTQPFSLKTIAEGWSILEPGVLPGRSALSPGPEDYDISKNAVWRRGFHGVPEVAAAAGGV